MATIDTLAELPSEAENGVRAAETRPGSARHGRRKPSRPLPPGSLSLSIPGASRTPWLWSCSEEGVREGSGWRQPPTPGRPLPQTARRRQLAKEQNAAGEELLSSSIF